MQTPKEMSLEIAEFCRKSANQPPKRIITKSGIGKAVLVGIVGALLVAAAPSDPGNAPARGNPWILGNTELE